MSQQQAGYRRVTQAVAGALTGIMLEALKEARNRYGCVDLDEVEHVLGIFRAIWPDEPGVRYFEGLIQNARQNWREAVDIFQALVDASQALPNSRAMLIYALKGVGDEQWRMHAQQLCDDPDPDISLLALSMLAQDDLAHAEQMSVRTGRFELPESAADVNRRREASNNEPDEVAAATQDTAMPQWMNYGMRI